MIVDFDGSCEGRCAAPVHSSGLAAVHFRHFESLQRQQLRRRQFHNRTWCLGVWCCKRRCDSPTVNRLPRLHDRVCSVLPGAQTLLFAGFVRQLHPERNAFEVRQQCQHVPKSVRRTGMHVRQKWDCGQHHFRAQFRWVKLQRRVCRSLDVCRRSRSRSWLDNLDEFVLAHRIGCWILECRQHHSPSKHNSLHLALHLELPRLQQLVQLLLPCPAHQLETRQRAIRLLGGRPRNRPGADTESLAMPWIQHDI